MKQESGGLFFLRRSTPLARRDAVYFRSGAYTKLRWRIERDYEELKQELGLGHFEGRNWRGFHHHATLCIAAYGFLVRERCLFSPAHNVRAGKIHLRLPAVPRGLKPRGSARQNGT